MSPKLTSDQASTLTPWPWARQPFRFPPILTTRKTARMGTAFLAESKFDSYWQRIRLTIPTEYSMLYFRKIVFLKNLKRAEFIFLLSHVRILSWLWLNIVGPQHVMNQMIHTYRWSSCTWLFLSLRKIAFSIPHTKAKQTVEVRWLK